MSRLSFGQERLDKKILENHPNLGFCDSVILTLHLVSLWHVMNAWTNTKSFLRTIQVSPNLSNAVEEFMGDARELILSVNQAMGIWKRIPLTQWGT